MRMHEEALWRILHVEVFVQLYVFHLPRCEQLLVLRQDGIFDELGQLVCFGWIQLTLFNDMICLRHMSLECNLILLHQDV